MTNLPKNPTKDELLQRHWFEFLQFIRADTAKEGLHTWLLENYDSDWERAFWRWYVDFKLEPTNAGTPPS